MCVYVEADTEREREREEREERCGRHVRREVCAIHLHNIETCLASV